MPEPVASLVSRILSLKEAVTVEELQNDEEYTDIVEDMREECSKVGASECCRGVRLCRGRGVFDQQGLHCTCCKQMVCCMSYLLYSAHFTAPAH